MGRLVRFYLLWSYLLLGCAPLPIVEPPWSPEPSIIVQHDNWTYWEPRFKVAPKYPRSYLRAGLSGCTNISYVINPDGTVSNLVLVKSSGSNVFERSSKEAALSFKYAATDRNVDREPVRTSNIFTFTAVPAFFSATEETLVKHRAKCEVDLTTLPLEAFGPALD